MFIESIEERIRVGEAVAPFLKNETIKRVFRDMDKTYWQRIKETTDPSEREALIADARALERFAAILAALVESGAAAKAQSEAAAQAAGN